MACEQTWPRIRLVAFGSWVKVTADPSQLPQPMGGTDLAGALELAAQDIGRYGHAGGGTRRAARGEQS
jgi:hypothetical protein